MIPEHTSFSENNPRYAGGQRKLRNYSLHAYRPVIFVQQLIIQSIYAQTNKQLQVWIDLNERAIAFPIVTLEIPNDAEIVQAATEILLLTEWNKALALH